MTIAYVSLAITEHTVSGRSPVVTAPAGILDGDCLLMLLQANTSATIVSGVEGWTELGIEVDSANFDLTTSLQYKVASGEGASWTMTDVFAANEVGRVVVIAYRGTHATTPINKQGQSDNLAATSVASPSLTPDVDNCMFVVFVACDPDAGGYAATPDASPVATERLDSQDAGNLAFTFIQEYLQGAAGALSLDVTGLTSDDYTCHVVALAPGPSVTSSPDNDRSRRFQPLLVR